MLLCLCCQLGPWSASAQIRDGGIDPANLGKGEWLWYMSSATNQLGGYVSSVTNENSLMLFLKSQGTRYVIVKAANSDQLFYGSYTHPQFTSNLVDAAHAHGLWIFGYNYSYGQNIPAEIPLADYVFNQGADGLVWNAEAEWESNQTWIGTNGPALAWQLCSAVRSNWPTKFLAHAPFAIVGMHSSFPYKEFGYWCDAVMPQIYHFSLAKSPSAAINWTDVNWAYYQNLWRNLPPANINGLAVYWTNAIKPLVPIQDVYGPPYWAPTPGKDVQEFLDYLAADLNTPVVGGYCGANFFRADLHDAQQWAYIRAGTPGTAAGVVNNIVLDDAAASVVGAATSVRTFYLTNNTMPRFEGCGSGTDTNSFGTNYLALGQGSGGNYVQFTPNIVVPGDYTVYQWHPYRAEASAGAPFVINYNGGSTTVYANQQINDGDWSVLGTFNFAAGSSGDIRVTDAIAESGSVALADGIKLVFVPATVPPAAPSGLTASAVGGLQIELSWSNNATNAVHNVVGRATIDGGPYTDIAVLPFSSTGYSDTALAGETAYYYVVRAVNGAGESANAEQASATTPPAPPTIILQPQSQYREPGQSATFNVTATGTLSPDYQWLKDGVNLTDGGNVSGATTPQLTLTNVYGNDAGAYSVVVSNPYGSVTSRVAMLIVIDPLITSQPAGQKREPGQSVTFSVTAIGTPPLGYQWWKDGAPLAEATSSSLTLTNLQRADAGGYAVVVSNPCGSVTSVVAFLTIGAWLPVLTDDFDADTSSYWTVNRSSADTRVQFGYDYSADGIPPAPDSGGSTRGVRMEANLSWGASAAVSISPLGLALPGDYRLRFDLWMNANGPFPAGGVGSTEHFAAGVGTDGNQVQWLSAGSSADGVWFAADGEGGSGDTTITGLPDFAAVTGTTLQTAESGVYAAGPDSNSRGNGHPYYAGTFPGGQSAPAWQQSAYAQQTGSLYVGTLGFGWRQVEITKIGNMVAWFIDGLPIATVANVSLTGSNVFVGYYDFYPSISDNAALSFGLVDNLQVDLEVSSVPAAPQVLLQPHDQIVPWLNNATFRVTAAGAPPLSYRWHKDGLALADGGDISGAATPLLILNSVLRGDEGGYSVVVTNAVGSVTSQVATLTVLDPAIVTQPVSQERSPGESVTFSVSAVGSPPLGYQWWKDGLALAQGTDASLTLANLQDTDAGQYWVVVSGPYGSVTSAVAVLTVNLVTADTFNPGANGDVFSLAVQPDGRILLGGEFTVLGGQTRNRIGRLNGDGTLDTLFNPAAGSAVYSLALQPDGRILAGGTFMTLGGQARIAIGRLNSDGTLDAALNPAPYGFVYSLAVQPDGKMLVGGYFNTLGGQTRLCLGRLNSDGTLDATFNTGADSVVLSLAVQPDGKILVGGAFATLGGQTRNRLGRLNSDGTLDPTFNPGADAGVYSVAVQPDGKVLVGGSFTNLAGQARYHLGRLNSDGTLDTAFNPGANGIVYSLPLQADGKILVGGEFTMLGGQTRNYLGRLNCDGTLDTTFNPGAAGGAEPHVASLTLQPDGKILVGGVFTTLAGQPRVNLGRLCNNEPATQSLSCEGSTLTWRRGGTCPEVWRTTLEVSTNGTDWLSLGPGTPVAGPPAGQPGGWQWTNVSVPAGATVRARGFVAGGLNNVSSWFVETNLVTSVSFIAWLQHYGLPTDGSADYLDTDGDGHNNWQEWRCQTCPTNALSVLRLLPVPSDGTNVTVTWQSVPGVTYFLERSTNLSASPPFSLLAPKLPGQPGTTTHTDTNAATLAPLFYRVGVP